METQNRSQMRSRLGAVRGLGAAKSGVEHWWVERISAAALVPLSLWFICAVISLLGAGAAEVSAWAAHPLNAVLLLALVIMTFQHAQLGMQVVWEDYIHTAPARTAAVLATKALALALALLGVLAVIKMYVAGH